MLRRQSKRSRKESTSRAAQEQPQQQELIDGIFTSERAKREYTDWICNRKFIQERGLEITVPAEWHWERFLAQPGDGIASIVYEFYANAGDTLDRNVCIVRGIEVDYSAQAINAYFGTQDYIGIDYYSNTLNSSRATEDLIDSVPTFFHRDARWNYINGVRAHLDYDAFGRYDRGVLDFVKARLKPNKHRVQIQTEIVYLAYCIRAQKTIDIGLRINEQLRTVASCGGKKRHFLCFPSLITDLCRKAGVELPQRNQVKVEPFPMITRAYIERHYQDGNLHVRHGEEEDEEMEQDAPADAAATTVPPHSPMDFDYSYYFARQEDYYRDHREFMEEQRGYMQRQQDAIWFMVQSTHGHNQAALGQPPQFPPPPPWCNDPRFLPQYMRQPPPPPPEL